MDETYDFVVVGSGGGSMCAGLVLRSQGKSVLILEKEPLVGGTTAKAGGVMWVPNNRFMGPDGVKDSLENADTYMDAVVGEHNDTPGASRVRRRTYVREASKMVDFLVSQGIKLRRSPYWPDYYDDRAGGVEQGRTVVAELFDLNELGPWKDKLRTGGFGLPAIIYEATQLPLVTRSWKVKLMAMRIGMKATLAKITGKKWVSAGTALQGRMLQAALRAGVDIRPDSPVRELIVEGDGVTGVVTVKDGKPWRVGARLGVLMNSGGFALNQAMLDKYIPGVQAQWTHVAPGDTGEMHQELMRIGAAIAQMSEMVGNQMSLLPNGGTSGVQMQLAKPHAFLVDQGAERYMNEGGSYMEFCRGMLARNETVPAIPSWWIMDTQFLRKYMLNGTMPGTDNKPKAWFDSGYLHKGDTIEALAHSCGLDPAKLKATTDRFNGFARKGRDEDFNRGHRAYDRWLGDFTNHPSAALGTVEEGPFYAVNVVPGNVGTYGGVITDEHARVLREDGSVIKGLYATGVTTASVMGKTYPGAGASIGPSFTWGYIAARHATGLRTDADAPVERAKEPA